MVGSEFYRLDSLDSDLVAAGRRVDEAGRLLVNPPAVRVDNTKRMSIVLILFVIIAFAGTIREGANKFLI